MTVYMSRYFLGEQCSQVMNSVRSLVGSWGGSWKSSHEIGIYLYLLL